jgi:hypothetical protein
VTVSTLDRTTLSPAGEQAACRKQKDSTFDAQHFRRTLGNGYLSLLIEAFALLGQLRVGKTLEPDTDEVLPELSEDRAGVTILEGHDGAEGRACLWRH